MVAGCNRVEQFSVLSLAVWLELFFAALCVGLVRAPSRVSRDGAQDAVAMQMLLD